MCMLCVCGCALSRKLKEKQVNKTYANLFLTVMVLNSQSSYTLSKLATENAHVLNY